MKVYKLGWKVVSIDNGRRLSHCAWRAGSVHYKFSKPRKPKKGCGPLCVFTNRRDAKRFTALHGNIIYPCAYLPSLESAVWTNCTIDRKMGLGELPQGKALADEVILLKEVK